MHQTKVRMIGRIIVHIVPGACLGVQAESAYAQVDEEFLPDRIRFKPPLFLTRGGKHSIEYAERCFTMRTLTLAWLAEGALQQQIVAAEHPCVVGRQADLCQIILDDRSVSRQHASIQIVNGKFCLRNLSEQNIITLNQEFRLAYEQEVPLKPGDTFRLGQVYLWVMQMDQPEKIALKVKCANCGKLSESRLEGFCPWCGRSLANGQLLEVAE